MTTSPTKVVKNAGLATAAATASCPAPGIYPNVPFHVYTSWRALNHSTLRLLNAKTPAHFRYALDHHEDKATPSKRRGTAIHELMLEPDRFFGRMVAAPINPTTGKSFGSDTKKWAEVEAANPGKLVLGVEDAENYVEVAKAAFAHDDLGPMLHAAGECEVCIVWDDPMTGLRCKARIDKLVKTALGLIRLDLKTCESASDLDLSRSLVDYGYGTQDAFYDRGCQALGIDAVGIFAAIEVVGHHGIRVYRVGREARPHLRQMVGDWLAIVRGCQSTGLWPSYATGIVEVNPPAWWFKQFADAEN